MRQRRRYYAADPGRRLRLARPVISVGNIAVGGRAKTPLVAAVAALLRDAGEVPAILSRGYARQRGEDGVVVVRDPDGIRADLARAGDEPMMLARQLPGVAVLCCADRYLAGRLAETHFGATVHVLDDGFQHLRLQRDLDIVMLARADLEGRTLPAGRLREPLDALRAADAVVALDGAPPDVPDGIARFAARRALAPARLLDPDGETVEPSDGAMVAVAGIAAPERFFDDLRASGWPIARTLAYRDHHSYTAADVARMLGVARQEGADLIVTTEKDAVRLLPFRPFPIRVAYVPLRLTIDPEERFRALLLAAAAGAGRTAA